MVVEFRGILPYVMSIRSSIIMWVPRAMAMGVSCFLALFAMDAFEGDGGPMEKVVGLLVHLIPAGLCVVAVIMAWEHEWLGGLLFGTFAGAYLWWAWDHKEWVLVMSGPLLLVAVLYLVAWRHRNALKT